MAIDDIQEIRRTLQNLLPGSRYATRVRAVSELGQYSDWSEALEFVAEGSSSASYTLVAPNAPTIQPQINAITVLMNYTFTNDGISLYVVEHSLDNVTFSEIVRTQIPLYVHQVPPGTTHYYRFSVFDIYGTQSPVSPSNSGQSVSALSNKPYATVVVAASDSYAYGYENADYLCDGVDDDITLSAAFNDAGSGTVVMLEGTYSIRSVIDGYPGLVKGAGGQYGTVIEVDAPISGDVIQCETIEGIYIWGKGNTINAPVVRAYKGASDLYIDDFANINSPGLYSEGVVSGVEISNCLRGIDASDGSRIINANIYDCDIGIMVTAEEVTISNSLFVSCNIGIEANAATNINNSLFELCNTGIWIDYSGVNVSGSKFTGCTLSIKDIGDSLISSNHFFTSGIECWGESHVSSNYFNIHYAYRALTVKAGSAVSFVANKVIHNSSGSFPGIPPIRIDNSTTGALVAHNRIQVYAPTGAFSDAGISTNYGAGNYINGVWVIPSTFETESDKFYEHTQGSANTTWTVTHNLAKYPSVIAVDGSGVQVFPGTVTYDSNMQVTLTFSSAQAGKAYCN
jgi:hypothetical protein